MSNQTTGLTVALMTERSSERVKTCADQLFPVGQYGETLQEEMEKEILKIRAPPHGRISLAGPWHGWEREHHAWISNGAESGIHEILVGKWINAALLLTEHSSKERYGIPVGAKISFPYARQIFEIEPGG